MRKTGLILGVMGLVLTGLGFGIKHFTSERLEAHAESYTRFGGLPGRYDQAVEVSYMSNCEIQVGDVPFCRCTLNRMSSVYTQSEFLAVDDRVRRDPSALPNKMRIIFRNCLRANSTT